MEKLIEATLAQVRENIQKAIELGAQAIVLRCAKEAVDGVATALREDGFEAVPFDAKATGLSVGENHACLQVTWKRFASDVISLRIFKESDDVRGVIKLEKKGSEWKLPPHFAAALSDILANAKMALEAHPQVAERTDIPMSIVQILLTGRLKVQDDPSHPGSFEIVPTNDLFRGLAELVRKATEGLCEDKDCPVHGTTKFDS